MYIPSSLEIKNTNKDKGLFSKSKFKNNNVIGREVDYFLATRDKVGRFSIQISKELFLDYTKHPHYLDFINHSCDPNMEYDIKLFLFYAIRDIDIGEELTYDYETTESDLIINGEDFKCKCGSSICRKYIIGYENRKGGN